MATEVEELIDFLSSPSPQLQKAALDIVRGLTGSDDGLLTLAPHAAAALPRLLRLLRLPDTAAPAAESLINLSQNPSLVDPLVSLGAVNDVIEQLIYNNHNDLTRLGVMLLANLTQIDAGVNALLQMGDGLYVSRLVRSFCAGETKEDAFEHVAFILLNISKLVTGRKILLEPKRGLLKQIIRQFDSTSQVRKKGVVGTIRNCCFEADNQLQNLLLVSEFLWPALLLPVAGKKEYSQKDTSKMPPELANALSHEREVIEDPEVRTQALEAIYLIALQEAGQSALWSVNAPRILEVGYEDEEHPKVVEAYESIGSLLVANGGEGL